MNKCKAYVCGQCLHLRTIQPCPGYDKCDLEPKKLYKMKRTYMVPKRMSNG
jgi:hypothetical protein